MIHIHNTCFSVDNKCYIVVTPDSCSPLNDPNNGVIKCFLGDDGVPSYEDIFSFTSNTGYELLIVTLGPIKMMRTYTYICT